ncbi:MAG TPA: hypothetical protein VM242_11220 [Acidimicrobiales bacterium]|jgi:hypothetical protein|nr:hypothetical protein [Acidimicrobiales bacterium]
MPDPVLPNPSGTGPLPGGDADSPLLPGTELPGDVPASEAEVVDPSPGDPPVIEGGAEPA